MTQDEIIEMADKADAEADNVLNMKGEYHPNWHQVRDEIFAKLVAAKEREALRERFQIVTAAETRAAILNEREACESIEYDLAKSPAMFATMAEYKSYRDGVEKYRAAIRARGEA